MSAKDYDQLNSNQQIDRLEKMAKTLGVDVKNFRQSSIKADQRVYKNYSPGEWSYQKRLESGIQDAMNKNYSYRTAMQYTDGSPVHIDKPQEALDTYRLLKSAHQDRGKDGDSFGSQPDAAAAAQHIFEQSRQDLTNGLSPKKDKKKKQDTKLAAPTEPVKTVLSKPAAEANAFVDAHNAMTLGNSSPLQGMAVSDKAGTSSPKAAAFKENFQLNLGGASTPLTFTEAITGTKPTIAAPFMDKYKDNVKSQLEPR